MTKHQLDRQIRVLLPLVINSACNFTCTGNFKHRMIATELEPLKALHLLGSA